jgi:hypothetical protein
MENLNLLHLKANLKTSDKNQDVLFKDSQSPMSSTETKMTFKIKKLIEIPNPFDSQIQGKKINLTDASNSINKSGNVKLAFDIELNNEVSTTARNLVL